MADVDQSDPWAVAGTPPAGGAPPQAASAAPPQAAPAAAPAGSPDPWAVSSTAPAPTTTPSADPTPAPTSHWYDATSPGFLRDHTRYNDFVQQAGDALGGVKKGLNETGATAMKVIHAVPGVGAVLDHTGFDKSLQETQAEAAKPITGVAGATGYGLENVAEFLSGDEALKGLSLGAKMTKIAPVLRQLEKFPKLADALETAVKAAKTNPRTAAILASGAKQGVLGAGQAALHGQDVVAPGLENAVAGSALHGAGEAVSAIINKIRPTTRTIGNEVIPILASQERAASPLATEAATIDKEPALAAKQQGSAQRVIVNTAQDAARDALARVNETRLGPAVQTDPARLLAPPEDMQPYKFSIPTGEAAEVTPPVDSSGSSVTTPANSQYTGTTEVQNPDYRPLSGDAWAVQGRQLGITASTIPDTVRGVRSPAQAAKDLAGGAAPDRAFTGPETVRQANFKTTPESTVYTPPASGSSLGATVTGGGAHIVDDPAIAQLHLTRLEALRDGPDFQNLPADQQAAVTNAADDLGKQMDDYNAYRSSGPNFKPVDPSAAVANVSNFGEAADQVEAAAKPIYQKLDEVSGGEFSALRNQRKNMLKIMRQPSSPEALESAESKLQDAEEGIDNIFKKSKGTGMVSQSDLDSANSAWRDAKILDKVHAAVEGSFNHIPADISEATGVPREIRGKAFQQKLGSMLKKLPREDVERVVGKEGLHNLYRVANLVDTPTTSTATYKAGGRIALAMVNKYGSSVIGAGAGAFMGHPVEGAGAAVAADLGVRFVLNQAATNPQIGGMLDYAVRHNVRSTVFVPMIAESIFAANHEEHAPEENPSVPQK